MLTLSQLVFLKYALLTLSTGVHDSSNVQPTMRSILSDRDSDLLSFSQSYLEGSQPNEENVPTVFTATTNEDDSYTQQGLVYLQFYGDTNCTGDVTYSSGLLTDACIPANEYVRSPFSDDFYYEFHRPFEAFMITNVTAGDCESWAIVYYYDEECTAVYEADYTSNFTACRDTSHLSISNMLSSTGNCSFSEEVPISSNSYVISDYTSNCSSLPTTFTSYAVNSCFGYANESSTKYYCDRTSEYITQTQYYDSTNCTLTGFEYGHSTLEIPEACNKVHTPGEYDDATATDDGSDDSVLATTAYIGNACIIVYSSPPPTAAPTVAPTAEDLIEFECEQVLNGIDAATYDSDAALYNQTLAQAVAMCMTDVSSEDVQQITITSAAETAADVEERFSWFAISAVTFTTADDDDAISASYTVRLRSTNTDYDTLSGELENAVADGDFDANLQNAAAQTGATGFDDVTSDSISTTNLLSSSSSNKHDDDGDDSLSSGAIAGIVIAVVVVLVIVILLGWLFFTKLSGTTTSSTAQTNPTMTQEQQQPSKSLAATAAAAPATTNPMTDPRTTSNEL